MFIESAFIRKNTPKLKSKLEDLGWELVTEESEDEIIIECDNVDNNAYFFSEKEFNIFPTHSIDCKDNESLFLALVSLKDDTDYMQWFYCKITNIWIQCKKQKFEQKYNTQFFKATKNEIINHFDN